MYRLGHGVDHNLLAAADFHLIAAEAGDQLACRNLSEYCGELEEMALSGSQMASLFLCRMSNRGLGADKSQSMTWAWIYWAKKYCNPDADAENRRGSQRSLRFLMCISAENRRQGKKTLADMSALSKKSSPVRPANPGPAHRNGPKGAR
jgi:hypothetical protein